MKPPVISLLGADLRKAQLKEAVLRHTKLNGADLRSVDLWNSDIAGAHLLHANLIGADISEAKLLGENFGAANFRFATSKQTLLGCENWHYYKETDRLQQAEFSGANLEGTNLGRTILDKANLMNEKLAGASLEKT